jgi:sugar/nucleoside kinase (ribokinase family)
MVRDDVDLLFANEHELRALHRTDDLAAAMAASAAETPITVCTVGARGAHVLADGGHVHVPAEPTRVVDATGAGDLFAAGFLHGLLAGRDWTACARLGCIAAAEVISHIGARPEKDLGALFRDAGLA